LITLRSHFRHAETMTRLDSAIRACGMQVLARIDHAALATLAGTALLPAVVVVFGDIRDYAPFIRADQATALDLPFRMLVREDAAGETWLSHDDVRWRAMRYGVLPQLTSLVVDAAVMLETVMRKTALPP
jgi:uncharacterized protein (DUF302 family)